jgi:hypothetical protein
MEGDQFSDPAAAFRAQATMIAKSFHRYGMNYLR